MWLNRSSISCYGLELFNQNCRAVQTNAVLLIPMFGVVFYHFVASTQLSYVQRSHTISFRCLSMELQKQMKLNRAFSKTTPLSPHSELVATWLAGWSKSPLRIEEHLFRDMRLCRSADASYFFALSPPFAALSLPLTEIFRLGNWALVRGFWTFPATSKIHNSLTP